jgi:hypothetical protein
MKDTEMRLRVVRFALGLLTSIAAAAAAQAAGVTVTVSGQQGPVAGAAVCVGTAADRGFYGVGTTNQTGSASFSGLPENAQVLVTARSGNRGAERAVPTALGLAIVMLPARAGGPGCPASGGSGAIQTGPIKIDRQAIKDKFAEVGGQTITMPPDPMHPAERCFGAAGSQCGFQQGLGNAGFCVGSLCPVNGGSWAHDECCWRMWPRAAKGCVAGPIDNVTQPPGNACSAEWDLAASRTFGGWSWFRTVNTQELNTTGVVRFAAYCARPGSVVHRNDVQFCCSRTARGVLDADLALLGTRIAMRSTARICN